jgi:hypothetical protein
MVANHRSEELQSDNKVYTCIICDAPHDAENLFVGPMDELAQTKGQEDGPENAFIEPEDLPGFAVCVNCRYPDDIYTLAESMASSKRYHEYRNQQRAERKLRYDAFVTKAEANQLVHCCSCQQMGRVTPIKRCQAQSPGWIGCNILKGRKLGESNLHNPHKNRRLYVTSEDLLKDGKDGYAFCIPCIDAAVPVLKRMARTLGVSEEDIANKVRAQSLISMLKGVRRVGK